MIMKEKRPRRLALTASLLTAGVLGGVALTGTTAALASDFGNRATAEAGFVEAWGDNQAGQSTVPASLTGKKVVQLAATSTASYALTDDGRITAWGDNGAAAAAIPSDVSSAFVVAITASPDGEVYARTREGALYGWGCPNTGSYPDVGDRLPDLVQPMTAAEKAGRAPSDPPLPAVKLVTDIASNNGRTVAVTTDGELASWQCGDSLGNRPYTDSLPSQLSGTHFAHVAASGTGFIVTADGTDPTAQDSAQLASWWNPASPTSPVEGYRLTPGRSFTNAFSGSTAWMQTSDQAVIGWNGVSDVPASTQPASVTGQVTHVASASAFSLAVTSDGRVSAWDNSTLAPVSVPAGLTGRTVTAIAAGGGHALALVSGSTDPVTGGEATLTAPPASVEAGAWESDTQLRVFGERHGVVLSSPLVVDGTTIPAGTKVNSYYVHADPVGNANVQHIFTGSLAFPTQVLGTAVLTADLEATTPLLGAPGTTYSTSPDQGAERWYDDSVTKTANGNGVSLKFSVYNSSDAVRIITLAP